NLTNTAMLGELQDKPGPTNNVRLFERSFVFDPMNRLTGTETAFFNPTNQAPIGSGLAARGYAYSDNSQLVRVTNENNHVPSFAYDTANRRQLVTDAKGNAMAYIYDANGNVTSTVSAEKSDLGGPDQVFSTLFGRDNLDRLVSTTDNVGNITRYG